MMIDTVNLFHKTSILSEVQFQLMTLVRNFNLTYFYEKNIEKHFGDKYVISLKGKIKYYPEPITLHVFRNPLYGYVVNWTYNDKIYQEHLEYLRDKTHWEKVFIIKENVI